MPNLQDPHIMTNMDEFDAFGPMQDDKEDEFDSDDEMSELGMDPARWFVDNNPHAATATGAVHLEDPDDEYYDSGHGRLEAVLAEGRYYTARANPKKLIDKPVAVHKHSPRKLAKAAALLPHIRFLQTPEANLQLPPILTMQSVAQSEAPPLQIGDARRAKVGI